MKGKKGIKITGVKLEKRNNPTTGQLIIENVPILLEFRFDGFRVKYPVGYRIDLDKWNESEQRVKRNNFNKDGIGSNIINKRIQDISDQLNPIYESAIEKGFEINPKYIISEINDFLKAKDKIIEKDIIKKDIQFYLSMYIQKRMDKKEWSIGTKKKYEVLKNHLKKFNLNLHFNDITTDLLQSFVSFSWETLKHNNVTNEKNLKLFLSFLRWAKDKGYNTKFDFEKFKQSYKGNDTSARQNNIVFLSWDELQHLNNFDFSENKRHERIRDIFCFCCFTSLRYSDILNLKKSDVKTSPQGKIFIQFTTIKTNDSIDIELNKYALVIFEKYKDNPTKSNKLFPVPTNQKYNDYVKEVCKKVGFTDKITLTDYKGNERKETTFEKWQIVSTHTARKTFITNALYLGIQPDIIRSWTGHKDHKTLELYIKIVNEQKSIEMDKFNNR